METSSCTDLIFTSSPNLVIESGVHSSYYENRHHHINYFKFNLTVVYQSFKVWHYKQASSNCIQQAIESFDWEKAFSNFDISKKVLQFSKAILNISHNFSSLETISCVNRDDKLQKSAKICLLGNCFSDLFTGIEIWHLKTFKFVLGCFLER